MLSRRTLMQAFFALPIASLFVKKAEAKEVSQVPPLTTPEYARKFFDDHVPTGIPELDNALGGGFPRGKVTSVTSSHHTIDVMYNLGISFEKRGDGVVVFGGEYGGSYVSISDRDNINTIDPSVFTKPFAPEIVYQACDDALKQGKAVVFLTSRKPMIGQTHHNRLPDVYVVFDSTNEIFSFSVLTVKKKF